MNTTSLLPPGLPPLEDHLVKHLHAMHSHLADAISAMPDGFMPFEQWMDLALYAPGLGYYAAGNTKFGDVLPTGDFTTAPESTPLFGQTLARQVAQILQLSNSTTVLEFGAGSGALAASLIPVLRDAGIPVCYKILEVSADLRARQQERLADFAPDVVWLDTLPVGFAGCVLANEVLDAMPATLFQWAADGQVMEVGVRLSASADQALPFEFAQRAASPALSHTISARMPALPGYQSDINLRAEAWMRHIGDWLERGAALLIDYGFPQREYYHPQRAEGTLMCHFRHHAHSQPLIYPGLQDITAHVDFTAMADAALDAGLQVLGYTSQARFLMNAGIADLLITQSPAALSTVQKLLSEAEMGELFKVLAVGRHIDEGLIGFQRGDRRDSL